MGSHTDWKCFASRLALTRARFAAVGLDPSALPVCVAPHSVGWDCPGLVDTLKLLPEGATDAQNSPAVFA
jgi:hypothetical protein